MVNVFEDMTIEELKEFLEDLLEARDDYLFRGYKKRAAEISNEILEVEKEIETR